jgi:DnaJ-domain-containing protein 1
MAATVKRTVAQVAFQLAVSLLEYQIRAKLKEKGIDPVEFEKLLRDIMQAHKTGANRSLSSSTSMTVASALKELGVPVNATPAEIKTKFKGLVLENHTDQTKNPATEVKLRKVIEAYNTLKDAGRVR